MAPPRRWLSALEWRVFIVAAVSLFPVAILSGLLLRDADPVLAAFQKEGLALVKRLDEGEWAALELRAAQA